RNDGVAVRIERDGGNGRERNERSGRIDDHGDAEGQPAQPGHPGEGANVGATTEDAHSGHVVDQRLDAEIVAVEIEGDAELALIEAERVRIAIDQGAVSQARAPQLAREQVDRLALVAVP